jgi:hypothetical protein
MLNWREQELLRLRREYDFCKGTDIKDEATGELRSEVLEILIDYHERYLGIKFWNDERVEAPETMNFYVDVDKEIERLENILEDNEQKYLDNIEALEAKVKKIGHKLDRTQSSVKREILARHIDFYENEIEKMDDAIEIITTNINGKIDKMKQIKSENEERKKKEKESLEYNIQNLKDAVHRGNSSEIFNMFKSVTNALDLIRAELRKEA